MQAAVPTIDGFTWEADPRGDGLELRASDRLGAAAARATLQWRSLAPGEHRATLECEVDAEFRGRGLGRALLKSAEDDVRDRFSAELGSGHSVTLCVDTTSASAAAEAVFRTHDLVLAVAEDEMSRPLPGPPPAALPHGMATAPWDEASTQLFFEVYDDAFRERPGFPGWNEERWRAAFVSSPAFRPNLSFVVRDAQDALGYAVCWAEGETGWVVQMGVRPSARERGLGRAILAHAMDNFTEAGLREVALEVATNNPGARRLYESLGFRVRASRQSWRKPIR